MNDKHAWGKTKGYSLEWGKTAFGNFRWQYPGALQITCKILKMDDRMCIMLLCTPELQGEWEALKKCVKYVDRVIAGRGQDMVKRILYLVGMAQRGVQLTEDDAVFIKRISDEFSHIFQRDVYWEVLPEEKRKAVLRETSGGSVQPLLPGFEGPQGWHGV